MSVCFTVISHTRSFNSAVCWGVSGADPFWTAVTMRRLSRAGDYFPLSLPEVHPELVRRSYF